MHWLPYSCGCWHRDVVSFVHLGQWSTNKRPPTWPPLTWLAYQNSLAHCIHTVHSCHRYCTHRNHSVKLTCCKTCIICLACYLIPGWNMSICLMPSARVVARDCVWHIYIYTPIWQPTDQRADMIAEDATAPLVIYGCATDSAGY